MDGPFNAPSSPPETPAQPSTFTTNEAPLSDFPSERTGNVTELDALIADLERKASAPDKSLFKNSFNSDFRLISETFNRLRTNMNPSVAATYDNKLKRLELVFIRAISE